MKRHNFKLAIPKGAEAFYIAFPYAIPMIKSKKNPNYYYYHRKYPWAQVYTTFSRKFKEFDGYLLFPDGRAYKAEPTKIVGLTTFGGELVVYIVRVDWRDP